MFCCIVLDVIAGLIVLGRVGWVGYLVILVWITIGVMCWRYRLLVF